MPDVSSFAASRFDRSVADAALAGLQAPRKTLPAKLFYDEEGCRLFYKITELPEYYLTRAEQAPLAEASAHVAQCLPAGSALVEYGASSEDKALPLLDARNRNGDAIFSRYVPIDIAAPALDGMRSRLASTHPALSVMPVIADFTEPVALPQTLGGQPSLGFFPGSTIGNLEPNQAAAFLRRARAALAPGSQFLLGADMRKDPAVLLPAYDDPAGVTAAFNLNLLARLNREAGANFDLARFRHRAVWNDAESRIEMHLVSTADQTVHVAGVAIAFAPGETIHTENSYKHAPERMASIAARGGWRLARRWTDRAGLFGVYLFEPA